MYARNTQRLTVRPKATTSEAKTGYGRMEPTDPRLLVIAQTAEKLGQKPAAAHLHISSTLVRRAMKVHGVNPKPIGWHMRTINEK